MVGAKIKDIPPSFVFVNIWEGRIPQYIQDLRERDPQENQPKVSSAVRAALKKKPWFENWFQRYVQNGTVT